MSKVDLSVIGTKTEERVFEYKWSDVVLYNLGVGASEKDLAFVYENAPGGLKVLPSFCVVPAMRAFPRLGDDMVNRQLSFPGRSRLPAKSSRSGSARIFSIRVKGPFITPRLPVKPKTANISMTPNGLFFMSAPVALVAIRARKPKK